MPRTINLNMDKHSLCAGAHLSTQEQKQCNCIALIGCSTLQDICLLQPRGQSRGCSSATEAHFLCWLCMHSNYASAARARRKIVGHFLFLLLLFVSWVSARAYHHPGSAWWFRKACTPQITQWKTGPYRHSSNFASNACSAVCSVATAGKLLMAVVISVPPRWVAAHWKI